MSDLAKGTQGDDPASPRRRNRSYLPTLFDRLCDDAPTEASEPVDNLAVSRSRLREIVLRDLQTLLNTTDISEQLDATRFAAAAASSINFGLPALAGSYLSEKKWDDIEHVLRVAIGRFEPRLVPQTLVVRPIGKERSRANFNVLTFEISGHIQMAPYPISFMVQSSVDLETSRIDLRRR